MTKLLNRSDLAISASDRSKLDALQRAALEDPKLLEEAEALSMRYREDQARSLASKLGITKDEALAFVPRTAPSDGEKSTSTLDPNHILWIKGQLLTVAELVARGEEFDGCAMADPIEGPRYGTSTAIFYWNNGKPCIHSLAHGLSTTFLLDGFSVISSNQMTLVEAASTSVQEGADQLPDLASPLQSDRFPHVKGRGDSLQVRSTYENFQHLMAGYEISAAYNVISKEMQISIPGMKGSVDNQLSSSITRIESLAVMNGMSATPVKKYLGLYADEQQFNPIAQWILGRAWDGKDRLPKLYATLTTREDFPDDLKRALLYRWLLSAVAAALMHSGFHCRGVLTLQGKQGLGKTSWILNLISDLVLRDLYALAGHHLDPANKDSVLIAIQHWIVELGELDSSFKKDIARIKGLLTAKTDKIRKPYASAASEFQRRTVFAASVNEHNFLLDPTGNSRWWVLPVIGIDYNHDIDMQQVFAQLAVDFNNGAQWWLTADEERMLAEQNRAYEAVSVVEEALLSALDFDLPEDEWQRLTASDVLRAIGFEHPTNAQARECGTLLRRHFGEPKKIKGITKWRVPIPKPTLG